MQPKPLKIKRGRFYEAKEHTLTWSETWLLDRLEPLHSIKCKVDGKEQLDHGGQIDLGMDDFNAAIRTLERQDGDDKKLVTIERYLMDDKGIQRPPVLDVFDRRPSPYQYPGATITITPLGVNEIRVIRAAPQRNWTRFWWVLIPAGLGLIATVFGQGIIRSIWPDKPPAPINVQPAPVVHKDNPSPPPVKPEEIILRPAPKQPAHLKADIDLMKPITNGLTGCAFLNDGEQEAAVRTIEFAGIKPVPFNETLKGARPMLHIYLKPEEYDSQTHTYSHAILETVKPNDNLAFWLAIIDTSQKVGTTYRGKVIVHYGNEQATAEAIVTVLHQPARNEDQIFGH